MKSGQTADSEDVCVSHAVVEAVAAAEGCDPLELAPLNDAVDPEALDQLFASTPTAGRMDGQVVFTYAGYEVTVGGDGHVAVANL